MEIIAVFPKNKNQKLVVIESKATFIFKNCPKTRIISNKVEIPEIGAEWYDIIKILL